MLNAMLALLTLGVTICPELRHAYHETCCGKSVLGRPTSPVDCDEQYYVNCIDMKAAFETLTSCCDDTLADRSAEAFCPADGRQLVRHFTNADMRAMPDWFRKDVLGDVDVFRVRAKLTPEVYPEFGNMSFSDTVQTYVYVPTQKRLAHTHIVSSKVMPFNIKYSNFIELLDNDGFYEVDSHGGYAKMAATTGVPVIAAFAQGVGYGVDGPACALSNDPYVQTALRASGVQDGDDLHVLEMHGGAITLKLAGLGAYADYKVRSVFAVDPWVVATGSNISNWADSIQGTAFKAFASGLYDVTPSYYIQNFDDYVDPLAGEVFAKFQFGAQFIINDLGQFLLTDFAWDRLFGPSSELDDWERHWTTKRHSLQQGFMYWRATGVMKLIDEHGIDAVLRPTDKTITELARPFTDIYIDPSGLGLGADTHIRFYKNTPDSPFTNGEYQQTASEFGIGDSDDYHLEYALRQAGYTNVATVDETSVPTYLVDIVTEQKLRELDLIRATGTEMPPCDFPLFLGKCPAYLNPPTILDSVEDVRTYESNFGAFRGMAFVDIVHHVLSS